MNSSRSMKVIEIVVFFVRNVLLEQSMRDHVVTVVIQAAYAHIIGIIISNYIDRLEMDSIMG